MKNRKALVVLSGGQDSTTCLFWAIDKFGKENVSAIGFDYGQRHKLELECADKICKKVGIPYEIVPTPIINQLSANSLVFKLCRYICKNSRHNRPCNRRMRNRFFWLSGLS